MNSRAFRLLIWNTIQKELRSKTFFMVVFLTFVMLAVSFGIMQAVSEYLKGESKLAFVSSTHFLWIYYSFINAWSIFLGLMFGLGCVRSDVNSQVVGQLLALPISRSTYILARVLGSWILVGFYQLLSLVLTCILFRESLGEVSPLALALAPLISLFPILAAIAIGLFVSLWVGKGTGLVLTGLASIAGGWARTYFTSVENPWSNLGVLKIIGLVFWILIPRFAAPHSIVMAIADTTSELQIAWVDIAQFSITTALLFLATSLIFSKRGY